MLCALFLFTASALALLSSGVYRRVHSVSQNNFTARTALSYLINQVHAADSDGQIQVARFGDGDALCLVESGPEQLVCHTWLYIYDGWLRELYLPADLEPVPAHGTPLLELSGLEIRSERGFITVTVTDEDAARYSTSITHRSPGGAAP